MDITSGSVVSVIRRSVSNIASFPRTKSLVRRITARVPLVEMEDINISSCIKVIFITKRRVSTTSRINILVAQTAGTGCLWDYANDVIQQALISVMECLQEPP